MTGAKQHSMPSPRLVWVYPATVKSALDSATWLETTRELRTCGWDVTLLAKGPAGEHLLHGVAVTCLPTWQKYFLGTLVFHLRVLLFLLRRWRTTDVILFHQLSAMWLLPLRLLRWAGAGRRPLFVMDIRDLNVIETGWKNRLRRAYYDFVQQLANRWVDGQTAITPRMADLVQIPREQVWGYWPSGVSLERFADADHGRQWPGEGEPIHLIYIGKLHSERNLLPLCDAVEQVNAAGLAFTLTYVGSGPEAPKLQEYAQRSDSHVRVLPPVSHDQIPALLRQAHVGVTSLPAPGDKKFEASSPVKLFEYMAAGLPIFTTTNVCHTDVVGAGVYAFWADGADPATLAHTLVEIWRQRAELPHLGRIAKGAAQAWTWQAAGRQLDQALRSGLDAPAVGQTRLVQNKAR
jgi:glycosyltransferase involved in cell wall biosynthesis